MAESVKVTSGGADWLPASIKLYKDAFVNDPALFYFINAIPLHKQDKYREILIRLLVKAAALNNSIFYYGQQGDYKDADGKTAEAGCRGVLVRPGVKLDGTSTMLKTTINLSALKLAWRAGLVRLLSRTLRDFQAQTNDAKTTVLKKGETFYYMYWMATDERERGKGLASDVIRAMQVQAQQDNTPLWTEASTPRAARVYANMGFEKVRDFRIGKGKADEKGFEKAGGEGVPMVAMIWRPRDKNDVA